VRGSSRQWEECTRVDDRRQNHGCARTSHARLDGTFCAIAPSYRFHSQRSAPQSARDGERGIVHPARRAMVRGVVVFAPLDLDEYPYDNREWRALCARIGCAMLRLHFPREDMSLASNPNGLRVDAAAGGGQALLALLQRLARVSAHPELAHANVLVWGMSRAGRFGVTFAALHPDRTIGVIHYHGGSLRGASIEWTHLTGIPILTLLNPGLQGSGLPQQDGALRTPWTILVHPGPHSSVDGLLEASPLQLSWIEAVFAQRVGRGTAGELPALLPVNPDSGWLGNTKTSEIARPRAYTGDKPVTTWLPSEAVALSWVYLRGACSTMPGETVAQVIGSGARVLHDDGYACEYGTSDASRRLIVYLSGANSMRGTPLLTGVDQGAARTEFERDRVRANGVSQPGLGDAAYGIIDSERTAVSGNITKGPRCSVLATQKLTMSIEVSLCGQDLGTMADLPALARLVHRMLGGLQ
jgi:hypothetical protein